MTILAGIVFCYLLSIVIGRHARRVSVKIILLLALLAAVQVAVVIHQLFTLESPLG